MVRFSGSVLVVLGLAGCASTEPTPSGPRPPKPLFTFAEDGDVVAFRSPATVALERRSGPACTGELPANGNMWSGPEVEQAFRATEVQRALARGDVRLSHDSDALLTAAGQTVTWEASCDGCTAPGRQSRHFYGVMHTVLVNRRLVCAER